MPNLGRRRGLAARASEHIAIGLPLERRLAGDAVIGNDRERPEVCAMIEGLTAKLLRTHRRERADDSRRFRRARSRVAELRDAEVEDLDDLLVFVRNQEDPRRLEIPEHD